MLGVLLRKESDDENVVVVGVMWSRGLANEVGVGDIHSELACFPWRVLSTGEFSTRGL